MLNFEARGDGPRPMIIIHGFLGQGRNLGALARAWGRLAPELRFLLPDLPGHGRSPALDGRGVPEIADALVAFAESEGLTHPFPLVGHSLGGRVALAARQRHPKKVGKVVLLDIRPGPMIGSDTETVVAALLRVPERTESRDAMRDALMTEGLSKPLSEWLVMSGDTDDDGFAWRIDREALADFREKLSQEDLWDAVTPDTVCIRGGNSTYVSDEDVARYREVGATVHEVEGCGHFLHAEKPKQVAELLAQSLD